eukprot:Anaeramoba_ignava/a934_121.p1 GENE.a934_121~~a934_121.p1  ORF type:complete len:175 (+),score=9.88 a934_121:346-870(+)
MMVFMTGCASKSVETVKDDKTDKNYTWLHMHSSYIYGVSYDDLTENRELIYFGKSKDYKDGDDSEDSKELTYSMLGGALGGLKIASEGMFLGTSAGDGSLMGLGVGLAMGLGKMAYDRATKGEITYPTRYLLIYDYETKQNEKMRFTVLYDTHSEKIEEIKEIMEKELNKRINS